MVGTRLSLDFPGNVLGDTTGVFGSILGEVCKEGIAFDMLLVTLLSRISFSESIKSSLSIPKIDFFIKLIVNIISIDFIRNPIYPIHIPQFNDAVCSWIIHSVSIRWMVFSIT